jgi:hypothetical protein
MMAEMSTFEWKWRRKPAKEGDRPHGKEVTITLDGEGALYAGKWTIRCILRRQVKLGHDIWVLDIDRLDTPPPPAMEDDKSEDRKAAPPRPASLYQLAEDLDALQASLAADRPASTGQMMLPPRR